MMKLIKIKNILSVFLGLLFFMGLTLYANLNLHKDTQNICYEENVFCICESRGAYGTPNNPNYDPNYDPNTDSNNGNEINSSGFFINLKEIFNFIGEGQDLSFTGLASKIVSIVLGFVAVLSIGAVIFGGVLVMFYSGNETKRKEGFTSIIGGIIGVIIVLGAYIMVQIVKYFASLFSAS